MKYPLIASRVFNVPLMIHPAKLDAIAHYMQARVQEKSIDAEARSERSVYAEKNMVIVNGVAFVGLQGVLVNRKGRMDGASAELTSYHQIRENIGSALSKGIKQVVLDVDSPGGEANGAYELAEYIYNARSQANILAVISGDCCSAAYFIASAANRVTISPTSSAGSIGVRYRRWDYTEVAKSGGVQFEDFYAGDAKLDGDPLTTVSDAERTRINALIAEHYQLFTASVAKYRGLSQQAVIDTQAQVFMAANAVKLGLADEVIDAHDAVNRVYQTIQQRSQTMFGHKAETAPSAAATETPHETLQIDTASLKAEGAKAERERIKSIVNANEAEGRLEVAKHLAFNTDMSTADAIGLLAVTPKTEAPKIESHIDKLMEAAGSPQVSAADSVTQGQTEKEQVLAFAEAYAKKRGII